DDCLGVLRTLRVDALRIRDARATVELPDGARAEVGTLAVEMERIRRAYDARISIASASFASGELELPIDAVDAAVRLETAGERLDVDRLRVRGIGIDANVHGSLERLCAPRLLLQATVDA